MLGVAALLLSTAAVLAIVLADRGPGRDASAAQPNSGAGSRGGASDPGRSGPAGPSGAPGHTAAGGPGEALRDSDFEFLVENVTCGVERVGTGAAGKAPEGRYCLVTVTVRNHATRATPFDVGIQRGFDAGGRPVPSDVEAGLYANGDAVAFTDPVAPGGQAHGILVFDVPFGRTLTAVELHESAASAGVRIATAG